MFDVFWMNIAAVFAIVNVILVGLLTYAYIQSWRKVRSGFTVSLIVFSFFFMVQNFVILIFWYVLYTTVSIPIVEAAAPYLTAVNAAEAVGLGMLARATWK
jgi:cytochrome bd-type quinol oxidase subunit 2